MTPSEPKAPASVQERERGKTAMQKADAIFALVGMAFYVLALTWL